MATCWEQQTEATTAIAGSTAASSIGRAKDEVIQSYIPDKVFQDTEDYAILVIRKRPKHQMIHPSVLYRPPHSSEVEKSQRCVTEEKDRSNVPSAGVVPLNGQLQGSQVASTCYLTSSRSPESGQEQLVPFPAMNSDFYCDLRSPEERPHDFNISSDFCVASSNNDTFTWLQENSEEAVWSEVLQPTTNASSHVSGPNSSSFSNFIVQQQNEPQKQQSEDSFASKPEIGFSKSFYSNFPEISELVDDVSVEDLVQSSNSVNHSQPVQPTLNSSNQLPVDSNLILNEMSLDIAELDQYLNAPEKTNYPSESVFSSIIHEDQYENLVAVQLDHAYDLPSTSNSADSFDLDPSILNEFFSPLDRNSLEMRKCCEVELSVSPSYSETFANLEPYLDSDSSRVSPKQSQCSETPPGSVERPDASDLNCYDSDFSIAHSYKETPEYRAKRDKNNLASQKSRLKRQNKFKMLKEEEVRLKRRNVELIAKANSLERQVQNIKDIIMKAITK